MLSRTLPHRWHLAVWLFQFAFPQQSRPWRHRVLLNLSLLQKLLNLTDGRVRGDHFGFAVRTSGNLEVSLGE